MTGSKDGQERLTSLRKILLLFPSTKIITGTCASSASLARYVLFPLSYPLTLTMSPSVSGWLPDIRLWGQMPATRQTEKPEEG